MSATTTCTTTRTRRSTSSSSATTPSPRRATPWWSWAATTPTSPSPTEFSVNARIAANLAVPVLLVVNGHGRSAEELRTTVELLEHELRAHHATLFAVIANRCRPSTGSTRRRARWRRGDVPGYAIPDEPLLNAPSVAELMLACDGTLVSGDEDAAAPGGDRRSWSPR